ncbi:hypothetical protein EBL87_09105 [Cereibacter sphaeroides]|uniref:hypothetical protein n=1 Tax=Cereibacter sphaeroides TaxID=1063 RepID=UPI000F532020|nr:hypothetical protein [Cereibacter sphaeroides]AZB63886.1 hypothetical protein EBL87_09105 [Cereibacter sphaeroides]AZB68192.1 hypothetical protein EBL86_07365 [Cereibacter sphaeroides]
MTFQRQARSTRQDDERVLALLAARATATSEEVGRQFGMSSAQVRAMTQRVLNDDMDLSGEDRKTVRTFYPWARQ